MNDLAIIGGGLAGLVTAIRLAKAGLKILVIEQKTYPFHRVCGEYISNEITPFLQANNLYPSELKPAQIQHFILTSVRGRKLEMPLDLGGFGISRYAFDHYLYEKALEVGVTFMLHTKAEQVIFEESHFRVKCRGKEDQFARLVTGAYGKRTKLDKALNRPFIQRKSPWVGVKYHIKADLPDDTVALHNFSGGYCGISKIEDDLYNLCYLSHRQNLKNTGSIQAMESEVLSQNPVLKQVFRNAEFVIDKPLVINEISFAQKSPVNQHILMAGDSAGMITPLCGNGMAMAIHGAKLLSETIMRYYDPANLDREMLAHAYQKSWTTKFARRLWYGRQIQKLFGSGLIAESAILLSMGIPPFARFLMKQTHGQVINATEAT